MHAPDVEDDMIRAFFCLVMLSVLAVFGPADASSTPAIPGMSVAPGQAGMSAVVSGAYVTLVLDPNPPKVGRVHAVVTVEGAGTGALARTDLAFSSSMLTMSMNGAAGKAQRIAPGKWAFDLAFGMPSDWRLKLQFAGPFAGAATYDFAVSGGAQSAGAAPAMASDSSGPWKTAALALVAILLIGAVVLRRDRSATTLGLLAGAAAFVVLLALLQQRFTAPAMDMSAMSETKGAGPVPVTFATVGTANGRRDIIVTGTIAPYLTQDIVARTSGLLQNANLYAGDRVAAGAVLATLDEPELATRAQTALADAQALSASAAAAHIAASHHVPLAARAARDDLASMQRSREAASADREAKKEQARYWDGELAREQSLLEAGAVSRQEFEDERAQAAGARAALAAASATLAGLDHQIDAARTRAMTADASIEEARLNARSANASAQRAVHEARTQAILAGYARVVAPNDGIIVKRLVDPGVYVQAGTVIARLAVVDRLRVQANVAQGDLAGIRIGAPLDVTSGGRTFHGRVTSLSPVVDATTRTAAVEAIVDNPGSALVPGGFGRIVIHGKARTGGAMDVPSAAIVGSGENAAVWTEINGTAHRVSVTVISDNGSTAAVSADDLTAKSRVVLEGASTLEEGQAVAEAPRS
jgi:RND family efflux transporter MFP subunit